MNNLKLYKNNCLKDVVYGFQIKQAHSNYTVGYQLSGASDVGKRRKNQEDSYIILEHPDNPDFKLLAVSDGVGGEQNGEIASSTVIKNLSLWFENLDPKLMDDLEKVQIELHKMLPYILKDTFLSSGAATLAAAIVGRKDTLIVNVGDSRVYTWKKGKLKQETKDDSEVQEMYDEGLIPSKELMRFKKESNIITQAITPGNYPEEEYTPRFTLIRNSSYDRIYAFTDGVTDCLSKKDLEQIIKKSKDNTPEKIVNEALNNDSYIYEEIEKLPRKERELTYDLLEIIEEDYYHDIDGGKDNTTAVEYRKK